MRRNKGFTLIELMIVIAIIAIIAAIAIPNLIQARKSGNEAAAIGAMKTIATSQAIFREGDKERDGNYDYGMLSELSNYNIVDAVLGSGTKQGYEFFSNYGVQHLPVGNTGAQMAGWYRKEIKTVEDLKGLKFRVGGLAGMVLSKLGVVPQQLAAGDLYPALEKGVLDAAEFVGPADDEHLGLHKVAKFYYYPGWWEGAATLSLFINPKAMAALPPDYAAALRVAAAEANQWSTAKYDVTNPQALRRLVAGGAQLRRFPTSVLNQCSKAATELYAELSEKSPAFKKIYTPWSKFRDEQVMWSQFCEMPFDNYMATRKA